MKKKMMVIIYAAVAALLLGFTAHLITKNSKCVYYQLNYYEYQLIVKTDDIKKIKNPIKLPNGLYHWHNIKECTENIDEKMVIDLTK